uniref:Uncharacterized protein LOC102808299 n=1 Tax=Saccoglossus kowalevskii TaxID=10224 RepID=A0ABM0M796_SACKO|nr:PREDICTED: uncharacterized protein LOC102808299 [Saccoglossus kowalevskii]
MKAKPGLIELSNNPNNGHWYVPDWQPGLIELSNNPNNGHWYVPDWQPGLIELSNNPINGHWYVPDWQPGLIELSNDPKNGHWCNEAYVTGCMLIQAVRSYLHFSQLSAWYSSTRGLNPAAVVYRICAPGESLAHNFEGAIDHHEFPKVYLDRTSSMKVYVKSLPRQKTIPSLTCIVPHTDKDDDDDVTSDLICEGFTVEPLLLHEAEKQGAKRKQCRPVAIGIQEGKTNNTTCEEKYQTNIPVRKKSQQMDILPRVKKQQTNNYDLYDSYSTYNAMQPEYGEKKQQTSKYDLYDSYSTHNAMQTENGEKKQQTRKYDLYGSYSNHNAMQTEYGGEISSIYANNPDDIERCLDELCLKDKREVFQKHEHKEKLAYKNEDGDFWLFRRKGRTLQGTLENVQKQTSSLLNTVLRRITDKKQPQEEHANESSKKCDNQFKVKSNIQDNPAQSAVKPDIQNSHAESAVKPDIQNNLAQSVVKPDIQDNFSQIAMLSLIIM